jgi:hypothetical protein
MARKTSPVSLEQHLNELARAFAADVAQAVRQSFAAQVSAIALGTPVARRAALPSAPGKRRYPATCLAEGCKNAHRGPRYSFLCATHDGLPKAEKKKLLSAWKSSQGITR